MRGLIKGRLFVRQLRPVRTIDLSQGVSKARTPQDLGFNLSNRGRSLNSMVKMTALSNPVSDSLVKKGVVSTAIMSGLGLASYVSCESAGKSVEGYEEAKVKQEAKTLNDIRLQLRHQLMEQGKCLEARVLTEFPCKLDSTKAYVVLVRHGQGLHNVAQRDALSKNQPDPLKTDSDGRYLDAELTSLGETQAKDAGEKLSILLDGRPISTIYSSPLTRAIQTVIKIKEQLSNAPETVVTLIKAIERGSNSCDKPKAKKEKLADPRFKKCDFSDIPQTYTFQSKEDWGSVSARGADVMYKLFNEHQGQIVLLGSHSAFLHATCRAALGLDNKPNGDNIRLGTGEMMILELSKCASERL